MLSSAGPRGAERHCAPALRWGEQVGTAMLWPFQVWNVVLGCRQTPRGKSGVAWSTISFLSLLFQSAVGEMHPGAPRLANGAAGKCRLILLPMLFFFLVPSCQEKMPLVIPHNNYNDAHPSSTDLICIQSGCQEGVFSPVLIRRKCSETVTGEDSFPLPCVGRLQREAEPPTGCVETDQTQEQRGNGRLSKGAGRVNWGGGCSCLAVNLNVALHRWERSIQAAVKLPLKLTEHFSVLRKK